VRAGTSRQVTSPDGAPTLAELAECLHDCTHVALLAAVPNQRSCFGHLSHAANSRDVVRLPEAWAVFCRHPLGPEVAEDSVHASVADGSCRPQLYQFVSRGRSGRHQTACNVLSCDDE
jgi:hypothetical protein